MATKRDAYFRGQGFVHLNTPQSILYSPGAAISVTELKESKSRVECITAPHVALAWRAAFRTACQARNMVPFVKDKDDEENGSGPVLPEAEVVPRLQTAPLPPSSVLAQWEPLHNRLVKGVNAILHPSASSASEATVGSESNAHAASSTADHPSSAQRPGIVIVSHHKVSGASTFVYRDYDGVMSSGVVPQIVVTAEEKQAQAEKSKYKISTSDMSMDELLAFEELQALWKTNATSRSEHGARVRQVTAGNDKDQTGSHSPASSIAVPGSEDAHYSNHAKRKRKAVWWEDMAQNNDGDDANMKRQRTDGNEAVESLHDTSKQGSNSNSNSNTSDANNDYLGYDLTFDSKANKSSVDMLEEALRLSEDLLRLY